MVNEHMDKDLKRICNKYLHDSSGSPKSSSFLFAMPELDELLSNAFLGDWSFSQIFIFDFEKLEQESSKCSSLAVYENFLSFIVEESNPCKSPHYFTKT